MAIDNSIFDNIITVKNRRVFHCPPHFIKLYLGDEPQRNLNQIVLTSDEAMVRNWLYKNISNRFFIGQDAVVQNSCIVTCMVVAFEDPADATFFSLVKNSIK